MRGTVSKNIVIDKTVKAIMSKGVYEYDILGADGEPLYGIIGDRTSITMYDYADSDTVPLCGIVWMGSDTPPEVTLSTEIISDWLCDLPDQIMIHATPEASIQPDAMDWSEI